jgi:hypothetical protein
LRHIFSNAAIDHLLRHCNSNGSKAGWIQRIDATL